jgi:hypothetical protein
VEVEMIFDGDAVGHRTRPARVPISGVDRTL